MTDQHDSNSCAILLAMGGPTSIADVRRYLYSIFCDRSIIRLPGGALLQKPLARLIAMSRAGKVKAHYRQIGGGSPLLKWTRTQADQITNLVGGEQPGFKCYVAMRYLEPSIPQTITRAHRDGFRHITFLPMFPQYSRATTGSAFEVARDMMEKFPSMMATYVEDFHDNEAYVKLLNQYIIEHTTDQDHILFSAHSLPQKFVDEGDPYVDQIYKTVKLAAGDREHSVSFQSRSGPVKWVGPDTVEEVKRLLAETDKNLFIVPVSFVCDHIETLWEIDINLDQLVPDSERHRIKRMPMFNDDPALAKLLVGLITDRIATGAHC